MFKYRVQETPARILQWLLQKDITFHIDVFLYSLWTAATFTETLLN